MRIDLDDASLMTPQLSGQSVTVTATVKQVATDALIVPVTAVAGEDPAHGNVLVVSGGGAVQRVAVTIIGTVDGRVALEPGGRLKAGDQVRVG
jgi:multidrug efflux pump subunit AcrA (membrane-fusion protein)